jgi:hypothetical protein
MLRIAIVFSLVIVTACAKPSQPRPSLAARSMRDLVLLSRDGCVNTATMRDNVEDVLRTMGLPADYKVVDQASLLATDARRGYPTPTLLYANRDVFGLAEPRPPYPEPS